MCSPLQLIDYSFQYPIHTPGILYSVCSLYSEYSSYVLLMSRVLAAYLIGGKDRHNDFPCLSKLPASETATSQKETTLRPEGVLRALSGI